MSELAWHFTSGPILRDGSPLPPLGVALRHAGPVKICESGLHASRRLTDALKYSPGLLLSRVEVEEIEDEQNDKLVCRTRVRVAEYQVDLRKLVRFACECAALAMFAAGIHAPELIIAAEHADQGNFAAAAEAAWAARAAARAAGAAADAAYAARAAAAAASATGAAAREQCEARCIELLIGGDNQ